MAGATATTAITALTVEDAHHLAVLRSNCVAGLVTLSEFARSAKALTAGRPATWSASTTWAGLPIARRWTVNAFRSARHRIVGLTPPRLTVVTLFGRSRVELGEVRLLGDDLHVTAVAVFGRIDVVVPDGLGADAGPPLPGAPRIGVRRLPLLGSVRFCHS